MKPEQVAQILNTLGDSAQLFRNNEFIKRIDVVILDSILTQFPIEPNDIIVLNNVSHKVLRVVAGYANLYYQASFEKM
ncbi:hypothetical protein HCG60_10910 [Ligilactobacillus murinus]|uniref:hypothetical protein n=1 Tax=Ligilactobacillus murinus TaxID=1622 RepID=UPI001C8C64BB|nr:hypothetical protein [Ligilactobacillus murinus]MBX9013528.1 hypothetical protein [Ligilactobacillus murinus]